MVKAVNTDALDGLIYLQSMVLDITLLMNAFATSSVGFVNRFCNQVACGLAKHVIFLPDVHSTFALLFTLGSCNSL